MNKSLPLSVAPKKICLLRLSALGDVTHALPVVRAIQKRWPKSEITWICGKLEHRLLSGIKNVRFVVFNKSAGWRAFVDLHNRLQGERFDVLLHMQVAARANLVSALVKADIKLGWDSVRSRDFHRWFVNHQVLHESQQHQVQGFLSFARALGIEVLQPDWDLPVSDEATAFANEHIPQENGVLLISPCSSHSLRNWPAWKYAKVADYAVENLDMSVVLSGGPSPLEQEMGRCIEEAMLQPAVNLVGKDTLQQSLAMLQSADVVISPDSGPAHIANALGTPVIGLYACTWAKRSGPYHSLGHCVDRYEAAAQEFLRTPAEKLRWGKKIEKPGVMDLIKVDDVTERLDRLFKR